MVEYPAWICADCGHKHGRVFEGHCATFHEGDSCGWCGKVTITTEPRDYGYPPQPNPSGQRLHLKKESEDGR